ncbi:MAG: hypothetical protein IVW55_17470 [Chloroflexi bacterium]|nr:hypothetical protein [Chloroflexota bacterium]
MNWDPKHIAIEIGMRVATGMIAGLLASWVTLQVMQQEIHDMNTTIAAQGIAINHANARVDSLELLLLDDSRGGKKSDDFSSDSLRLYRDLPP